MTGRTTLILRASLMAGAVLLASPAWAQAGITIPEPTDTFLFGMGFAGLVIGRMFARRKPDE